MVSAVDFIIGAGWIAFWAYWMVMAVKTGFRPQPRTGRAVIARLFLVAIILLVLRSLPLQWTRTHHSPYLLYGGLALFAIGLLLALWARVCLGKSWGFPAAKQQETELVTAGPYKSIRHPIYSGFLLAMLGTAIAVTYYWLVVFGAFFGYFVWSAFAEEKYLMQKFPKAYPEYVERTKMFLPFLF